MQSKMDMLDQIAEQIQKENRELIVKIKEKRKNMVLPLFITPIDRDILPPIYNLITSKEFLTEIKKLGNQNLDVIIDSLGGDADAAYHLSKMLHKHFSGEITYIVPRFAKSAATLLISGGDSVIMGPTSELGPLDPQIRQKDGSWISAKSVRSTLDLIEKKVESNFKLATIIAGRINPLLLGEYESKLEIAKDYQKELLTLRMFKDKKVDDSDIKAKVDKFAEGYTHHGRVIDYIEAKDLLKIDIREKDDEEWQLIWTLYMSHIRIMHLFGVKKVLEKAKDLNIE